VSSPPDFAQGSELLARAYSAASAGHAGQSLPASDGPYLDHPVAVARLVHEAGYDEEVVAAGLLHDLVEDSDAGGEELVDDFGERVAALVCTLTEDGDISAYHDRKADLRGRIAAAGPPGAALFAADKLATVRQLRAAVRDGGASEVAGELEDPPLDAKLAHYAETLRLLEREHPGLPFLADLRRELDALRAETHAPSG
jgi:(p)ppGpp synthase/HD superfamily hydrolase